MEGSIDPSSFELAAGEYRSWDGLSCLTSDSWLTSLLNFCSQAISELFPM